MESVLIKYSPQKHLQQIFSNRVFFINALIFNGMIIGIKFITDKLSSLLYLKVLLVKVVTNNFFIYHSNLYLTNEVVFSKNVLRRQATRGVRMNVRETIGR